MSGKIGAEAALAKLSGWTKGDEDRDTIQKTYKLGDFKKAIQNLEEVRHNNANYPLILAGGRNESEPHRVGRELPKAAKFKDYREVFEKHLDEFDAVIVDTPEQAIQTFINSGLDTLVIGRAMVDKT